MEAINSVSIVSIEEKLINRKYKEIEKQDIYVNPLFNWKVVSYDDLPNWLRDNDFVKSFYRPELPSLDVCFWSIFRVHNQTANIWTHLLAALLFNFILMNHFPTFLTTSEDRFVFYLVYIGVIICFYCSTIFHTFLCHSEKTAGFVAKLDYSGVSLHIFTNILGLTYFTYYCQPNKIKSFLSLAAILCSVCLYLNATPAFNQNTSLCRVFRSIVFFSFGFISIVPQISWYLRNDMQMTESMRNLILMDMFYILGMILYVSRFPERCFRGKCDLIPSHCWFHISIVAGSYFCYKAIEDMAFFSTKYPCLL